MKVSDLITELEEKKFFQDYKLENPKVFPNAAFLILDLKQKTEQIQLNYYNPKTNNLEIFDFPWRELKKQENKVPGMTEPKLDPNKITKLLQDPKIDLDDLEAAAKKIIQEKEAKLIPTKIIAILKDCQWNLTCMDDMLGIIRIKLDAKTGEVLDFNKGSIMDTVKIKR